MSHWGECKKCGGSLEPKYPPCHPYNELVCPICEAQQKNKTSFGEHPYIKLFEIWRKQFPFRVNVPTFIKGYGRLNHPLLQHRYLEYDQYHSSEQKANSINETDL